MGSRMTDFSSSSVLSEVAGERDDSSALVVDLGTYEGPLDVLLTLARNQKVDLTKISIMKLADQYLAFISAARHLQLEIAADYLVMAAWLAYLKSCLLLPPEEGDGQPTGSELAARLQWQLQRLESMRVAAGKLMARDQLNKDIFPRGAPEGESIVSHSVYELSLYEVLKSYADFRMRGKRKSYVTPKPLVHTIADAMGWLRRIMGSAVPRWELLESFMPATLASSHERRSAVSVAFAATLELAKQGGLRLRQQEVFGPIYIKRREQGAQEKRSTRER